MILEALAIFGAIAGCAGCGISFLVGNKLGKAPKKVAPQLLTPEGVMKYFWSKKYNGYKCPKCFRHTNTQFPYCECHDHHEGHYHFECGHCNFISIMETADKKESNVG